MAIVALNFGLFGFLAICNAPTLSESRFITAGLYLWNEGSFALASDTPPLARALGVFPLLARGIQVDPLAKFDKLDPADGQYELKIARTLASAYADSFGVIVSSARLAGFAWWGLGAWIIWRWSRELFGVGAGWVALILWGFCPNVLASECQVTPELPTSVASLGATYIFSRWLGRPSWHLAICAGLVLGVAQLCDFTALVLFAAWPAMWAMHPWCGLKKWGLTPGERKPSLLEASSHLRFSLRFGIGCATLIIAACLWVINLGYGFSGSEMTFSELTRQTSTRGRVSWIGGLIVPLPADYIEGVSRRLSRPHPSTPLSEFSGPDEGTARRSISDRGTPSFALVFSGAPLGAWLMLGGSLLTIICRRRINAPFAQELMIWIPLVATALLVLCCVAPLFPEHGLLIVAPFAILAMSRIACVFEGDSANAKWIVGVLLGWVVCDSLISVPHVLDFHNGLVEPPSITPGNSGKDIPALVSWTRRHPEAHGIRWACWSLIDPQTYGVAPSRLPVCPGPWLDRIPWYSRKVGPYPGWYALDRSHLALAQYEYFQHFRPVVRIGSSIEVYHIEPDEADRVRRKMGLPELADAALLKRWIHEHPEARSIGLACDYAGDTQSLGLGTEYMGPPPDHGPELAKSSSYTQRIGPYPGYYALDSHALTQERYEYFHRFEPVARLGSSISVYKISREEADRVRMGLGLARVPEQTPVGQLGLLRRTLKQDGEEPGNYAVFVPNSYTGERPYPLIVFLHGFGDAGPEEWKFLNVGLPTVLEKRRDVFNFLVLCPRSHSGFWPVDGPDVKRMMAMIEQTAKEYKLDRRRIYLTGVSSGATGVWDLAARYPDRWAAIAPVATGSCDPSKAASLKDMPCWCFHNTDDHDYFPKTVRRMIAALKREGGKPNYTEFPDLYTSYAHNAWDGAYRMDELYEWLIIQSK